MCYIPDPKRPIVFAVTVETGRPSGRKTAAPIARLLAAQWFRPGEEVRRRELAHVLTPLSPITAPEQAQPVADRSQIGPRTLRLPLDPLLTLCGDRPWRSARSSRSAPRQKVWLPASRATTSIAS